jgi:hypothetical protein
MSWSTFWGDWFFIESDHGQHIRLANWQTWSQLSSQPVAIGGVQLQVQAEERQVKVRRS